MNREAATRRVVVIARQRHLDAPAPTVPATVWPAEIREAVESGRMSVRRARALTEGSN